MYILNFKWAAVLLFVCLHVQATAGGATIEISKNGELPVVSIVAPVYPPIARLVNAQGDVIVSVSVNAQGEVADAKAVAGHKLLHGAAQAAALQWKFIPSSEPVEMRISELIFSFALKFEAASEVNDEITFLPPNRLKFVYKIPTIAPIKKVAGRVPEEDCPLHNERMKLGLAHIWYDLPAMEIGYPNDLAHLWLNIRKRFKQRNSYYEAEQKYFPEANSWFGGGCIVGVEKQAETLFCQTCRKAEMEWQKKHPGKGPSFVAVISGGSN